MAIFKYANKAQPPPPENRTARERLADVKETMKRTSAAYGAAVAKAEAAEAKRERLRERRDSAQRYTDALTGAEGQLTQAEGRLGEAKSDFQAASDAIAAASEAGGVPDSLRASRRAAENRLVGAQTVTDELARRVGELRAGASRLGDVAREERDVLAEAAEARSDATALGADLKALRAEAAELEAAARQEATGEAARLLDEHAKAGQEIEAFCRAAVADAEAVAKRLWKARSQVWPLVRRRDEIMREIRRLRGEASSPWTEGSTNGWAFPRATGDGEKAESLAELLRAVADDVGELARRGKV